VRNALLGLREDCRDLLIGKLFLLPLACLLNLLSDQETHSFSATRNQVHVTYFDFLLLSNNNTIKDRFTNVTSRKPRNSLLDAKDKAIPTSTSAIIRNLLEVQISLSIVSLL